MYGSLAVQGDIAGGKGFHAPQVPSCGVTSAAPRLRVRKKSQTEISFAVAVRSGFYQTRLGLRGCI